MSSVSRENAVTSALRSEFFAAGLEAALEVSGGGGGARGVVPWATNKRFKLLKFEFKFPIARTFELSFAPFWNRITKNEENHGGEKNLVQPQENRPGEAHKQPQLAREQNEGHVTSMRI